MKVALVGSWKEQRAGEWELRDKDSFSDTCCELGASIVQKGPKLIVGTESETTADAYLVEGAVQALRHHRPLVRLSFS